MENIEKVRAWLDYIGETCQHTRKEVRDLCIADDECMEYYVSRYESYCANDKYIA